MTDDIITKQDLLQGWRFVLEVSLEHYRDLTLPAKDRERWFKAYTDALYKATTLVRETETDILAKAVDELEQAIDNNT